MTRRYNIMNIKISLIDNDYVVRAKTYLVQNGPDDPFRKFVKQIKEELVTGQTAYLEIEDAQKDPVTFEITQVG
jgi:hypothetical protein